jgi:hypothetical protein
MQASWSAASSNRRECPKQLFAVQLSLLLLLLLTVST